MGDTYTSRGRDKINTVKSQIFNVDNGAGVTIDETLLRRPKPVKILASRIVYDTEAAGTIAAATAQIGTAVGGAQIVAATNLTNSAAIGSVTAMTVVQKKVPANTPIIARHTGIAATAAGQYHIEMDYSE